MEEKRTKLCFSIPSKPKAPTTRPAAAAFSVPALNSSPAPRYITAFDPTQTLDPPAAPAVVIAPLPDTRRRISAPTVDGPAFVPDASSDNIPSSSSSAGYGLAVRDMAERKRRRLAAQDAAAVRRFKQDMAVLPDIQGAEEYDEVAVEGFGAALLAGYGWKEGGAIGRDKTKVDVKIMERGRRSGTNGLGADPLDKKSDPSVTPVVRRSLRVLLDS